MPTVESELVFCWWDYPCFVALTALVWATLAWCLRAWVASADWWGQPVLFGGVTLLLAYNIACHQFRWFLLLVMRRPRPRGARVGWRVGVATTFVPGAEPLEMLEATVTALVAMDDPHDTWVLDEGDDARVLALCARLGAPPLQPQGPRALPDQPGPLSSEIQARQLQRLVGRGWLRAVRPRR
jgi:hypothetical protein